MRKGLTLTLMTIASAMLGTQAQAMAPTIADIPSPIVANDIPVTGGGQYGDFVFLDAMDLNTLATDDVTAPSDLLWTYTGSKTAAGASSYKINGVNPINLGTTDPTSPTTSLIINRNDDKAATASAAASDQKKNTITIRNEVLSPMAGGGIAPPTAKGLIATYSEPVTFFCSDGNAFSSQTVFFYTDNGGSDRLSGGDCFAPVPNRPVDKITKFWRSNEWNPFGATGTNWTLTTSTYNSAGGICLKAGLKGQNWGALVSDYPYFQLAPNQVYRIKMKMIGSQATGGKTPFWDFILENYDDLPSHNGTLNMYIFVTQFYDTEGGGNALTSAGKTVTLYWAPPAVATTQWNHSSSGAFTTGREQNNDPRLRFRTVDVDGYGGGETRSGDLCIQEIEVTAASLNRCREVKNHVNITSFVESKKGGAAGNVTYAPFMAGFSTATFSGGAVTVTPGTEGAKSELAILGPSTDGDNANMNPADPKALDEYPIPWTSDKILRTQVDLTAPTSNDELHPWDAICFLLLSFTNEVNSETYISSSANCGAPKTTTQTYYAFNTTAKESLSTTQAFHKLRWEVRFANTQSANFPTGAEATNTGSVKVSRVRVDEVEFK